MLSKQRGIAVPSTIVCLHASGSSGGQWSALRAQLEPDLLVLSPDFHGHGAGPSWHGPGDEVVAADVEHVARMAESAPGDVHLVGHSYGGSIALRVALEGVRSVASVTVYEPVEFRLLFDWHGRQRPAMEILEGAANLRRLLRANDRVSAAARFVEYWGGRGAWHALSQKQQAGIMQRIGLMTAHFDALANDAPRLADYRALRVPVLILAGREMIAPIRRIVELLRHALPAAAHQIIPAAGHMGPITHAGVVAKRIATFVRSADGPAWPDCRGHRRLSGAHKAGRPHPPRLPGRAASTGCTLRGDTCFSKLAMGRSATARPLARNQTCVVPCDENTRPVRQPAFEVDQHGAAAGRGTARPADDVDHGIRWPGPAAAVQSGR